MAGEDKSSPDRFDQALDGQRLARVLHESEERYRLIAENINDALFLTDPEGRLIFANGRAEVITGYTTDELEGRLVFNLLTPEGSRQAQERLPGARDAFQERVAAREQADHHLLLDLRLTDDDAVKLGAERLHPFADFRDASHRRASETLR